MFQVIQNEKKYSNLWHLLKRFKNALIIVFILINSVLVFVLCFKPADMHIYLYQYIYNIYEPADTEIVSVGRGPYSRAVPVNFYKKREFGIKTFKDNREVLEYILQADKVILYATKNAQIEPELKELSCISVYQNLPPGAKYYNFNNWVERTPFWTLYKCDGKDNL
jgi:hypothetical protein